MVHVAGLSKRYASGDTVIHAVSDLSFSIERGEFVAVVGRSGSGKSTLLNVLGLLERPDGGRYALQGRDVSTLSGECRAAIRNREIGFVFQLPTLLPRVSALENVELPLAYAGIATAERRRRAREAVDCVGLAHRADHWPHQLSGGEQQRIAIARALVNNPALILADEPTGALDSKTSGEILTLMDELNRRGRTIVVVTHAPDVAAHAHRHVMLHDGRIMPDDRARMGTFNVLAAAEASP